MSRPQSMPCLVLDAGSFDEWAAHFSGGSRIPLGKSPTVLHLSREVAEAEAKRLAARFPGRPFLILEARVIAATVKVPTHITLGGKVVAESQRPALIDLADDPDALPF